MRPSDAILAAKSESISRFGVFDALQDGRSNPRVTFGFASMVISTVGLIANEYAKACDHVEEFERFRTKHRIWAHRMAENAFFGKTQFGVPVPGDPDEQLDEEKAAAFWDANERLAAEMVEAPDGSEFGWEDFVAAVEGAPAEFAGYVEGIVEGAANIVSRAIAAGVEGAVKGVGGGLWSGIGPWTVGTLLVIAIAYGVYHARFLKGKV